MVGDYIEQIFPMLNVRFIAVNSHYDSNKAGHNSNMDFDMAVSNMINTMYSRDLSKKMRSAPSMYYDKQMMYRKSYGFFIGVHYILVVMSISLTVITIYMVMDTELNSILRLIISVLAAVSTNLQIVLRFDKVAEGYICAMRVLEQAILEYEERQDTSLEILLQANI
jgi:heme/copper-type cytochrome/quinol oxidase subunit 4